MDALDYRILQCLANDARRPYANVARELGVSRPTVTERVRRMEERGIILGAMLRLDHTTLGFPLQVFIRFVVTPQVQYKLEQVAEAIPQVVEMSRVTGEDCLIVRAVMSSVGELSEVIGQLSQYGASHTSIVLGTPIALRSPLLQGVPAG
jgi:Lrp/AsnC family transcriptional regulator, leucine-responsive regulatory protein